MGRRSRSKNAGPREPNGRSSRSNRLPDLNPAYSAQHRLAETDPAAAAAHLRSLSLIAAHESGRFAASTLDIGVDDEGFTRIVARTAERRRVTRDQRKELRGSTEIVLATTRTTNSHRKANLEFPIGLAFELGVFRQIKCHVCEAAAKKRGESCPAQFMWRREYCGDCRHPFGELDPIVSDGSELVQAADIYAGLHRQVWGKLSDDIEKDLARRHPAGLAALLENGPIRSPPRTASQFRQWVPENPVPADDLDPDEDRARRLKYADRYAAARETLLRAGLTSLHIVEHVVIDGIKPYFLRPGAVRTARNLEDEKALLAGLKALADHFGLAGKR